MSPTQRLVRSRLAPVAAAAVVSAPTRVAKYYRDISQFELRPALSWLRDKHKERVTGASDTPCTTADASSGPAGGHDGRSIGHRRVSRDIRLASRRNEHRPMRACWQGRVRSVIYLSTYHRYRRARTRAPVPGGWPAFWRCHTCSLCSHVICRASAGWLRPRPQIIYSEYEYTPSPCPPPRLQKIVTCPLTLLAPPPQNRHRSTRTPCLPTSPGTARRSRQCARGPAESCRARRG